MAKRKLSELEDFQDDKKEESLKKQKHQNEDEILSFFKFFCQNDLTDSSKIIKKINSIHLKE